MNEIIPGILEKEWSEIERKLEMVKPFAKTVHIDIIDGKFVNNTTFLDPEPFKKYADDFFFELHMMVDDPLKYLKPWAEAGFKRFLGHIEKMPDPIEFIAQGQIFGEIGLAIDGPTDTSILDEINLNDLDSILIYTSEKVGFSRGEFMGERLQKIEKIKAKYPYLKLEVDGGINNETIPKAKRMGADKFVTTSFLFEGQDIEGKYKKLAELVKD